MKTMSSWRVAGLIAVFSALLCGCSVRRLAVNQLGNALAGGASTFATDDDPDLIRDATPFALKTIESLLAESPRHEGLLLAATSGFTQYAWAFVQQDADEIEGENLERAQFLRQRAKRLYLRARNYGLRGLEVRIPGATDRLRSDTKGLLAKAKKEDVPLLYWTALSWGGAIALAKDDVDLTADLDLVEALMHRAMELDPSFESGSIEDFYISWDGGRPPSAGGSVERARQHLDRALELARGTRAGPYVTFAETVSVSTQNRDEFQQLLEKALAIDPDKVPEQRLANLIYQRRARWLLQRIDELFLE